MCWVPDIEGGAVQGPEDDFQSVENSQIALRQSIDEATRLAQDADLLLKRARQEIKTSADASGAAEPA